MEFCEICDNMYNIKIDRDNDDKIIYSCKSRIEDFVNQYTHLDPTLPRVNNMDCPNEKCPTNTGTEKNKEVIYIKYDSDNLKFVYLCCHCKQCWKNEIDGVSIAKF